jgi:RNA polymerase sigma factor (sigma-70 family)
MDRTESTLTGAELLERCARDRSAGPWRELLRRFRPAILGGIRRALNRAGRAARSFERDDLLQEVLCHLLEQEGRRLRSCRGVNDRVIGAYLGRIAESVVTDHLRAWAADKRGHDRQVDPVDDVEGSWIERALDPRPTPEQRLLLDEIRRDFHRTCWTAAGPRARRRDMTILHLAVFESYTSREISELLGGELLPSSIDSRVHRMRQRLSRAGFDVQRRLGD